MLDPYGPGSSDTPARPAAAIVLAAGEGTRMRSATPKVLHPIGGRSLLGHAVHAAAALEPEHLVVVVGAGGDQVRAAMAEMADELARPVLAAEQQQRLGTGHAVRCGLDALPDDLDGPVLVTYGDVPLLAPDTLGALLQEHASSGSPVTVLTSAVENPTGYGRVLHAPDGTVSRIVEERDASLEERAVKEINSGVYAFDAAFLRSSIGQLRPTNNQGELYLTDLVAMARGSGADARGLRCGDAWQVCGVNDRVQLATLRAELNRRLLERWMREGVTVVDPATTWIDVDVELAPDVTLLPNTQLQGATVVGTGATIGPDTTLTDVEVGVGATVVRTHGSLAVIGEGASVGPFAYLRPGTSLGRKGKIGTFVETKNAEIGAGSKVPHLSYVGDATIGEHSNIGAASVTVNYDGVHKHRTVIGSHARTGADNMFVAPVTVGDGAYTAAGSVIRRDVPAGALGVTAGQQRNIEGWVARRRPGTAAADAAANSHGGPSGLGDQAQRQLAQQNAAGGPTAPQAAAAQAEQADLAPVPGADKEGKSH